MEGVVWHHLLAFLVVAATLQSCAALRPLSSFWQSELPDESNAAPVTAADSHEDAPESSTSEIR
jgi:hypothetical protein